MAESEKPPAVAIESGVATPAEVAEIEKGEYYTVKQLAQKTGHSTTWISMLCKAGRIHAIKPTGGQWRIPPSEFHRILKEGIPPLPRQQPLSQVTTRIIVNEKTSEKIAGKPAEKSKKERKNPWWPFPFSLKEEEK